MREDSSFDLCRLDTQPTDLDLFVEAAEEFEIAIFQKTDAVSGLVKSLRSIRGKRIRNETLCRKLRLADISFADSDSADEQFARHADRDRLHVRIEHVRFHVTDGFTHGHDLRVVLALAFPPGCDGSLRWTVRVVQLAARQLGEEIVNSPPRQLFAAADNALEAGQL